RVEVKLLHFPVIWIAMVEFQDCKLCLPIVRWSPQVQTEDVNHAPALNSQSRDFPFLINPQVFRESDFAGVDEDALQLRRIAPIAGVDEVSIVTDQMLVFSLAFRQDVIHPKPGMPVRVPALSIQAIYAPKRKLIAQPILVGLVPFVPARTMLPQM